MPIFLHGLSLQRYRGVGEAEQRLSGFQTFNFFIGANNAGKSTVLNLISRHFPLQRRHAGGDKATELLPLERHNGDVSIRPQVGIGVPVEVLFEAVLRSAQEYNRQQIAPYLRNAIELLADESGYVWATTMLPASEPLKIVRPDLMKLINSRVDHTQWRTLLSYLANMSGGTAESQVTAVLDRIDQLLPLPKEPTAIIPALRRVGPKGDGFEDYSGAGLIDRLAQVQSPDHDRRSDRIIFDRINNFLQIVTDSDDARIEIPHNREHVLVSMNGRVLPLESLGTGIHQVVMIAAFCTISEHQIVCIEEPELHLHPQLQRKLMEYLRANTSNQYFIATHSASFIDTPGAAIFHVRLEDDLTVIRRAVLNKEKYAICQDLGHRASDIIQANAVIWVEGPSDRIYIKHWLRAIAPHLVEGTHFSIMFYGGRLLSHLSASDDEVTDFISLRSLNRNVAIVIDSDKATARAPINATKRRIRDEFLTHGGVAWITKGREIENYVLHEDLQDAVRSVHSTRYGGPSAGGRFDHALHFVEGGGRSSSRPRRKAIATEVDKVKVSRKIVEKPANLDVLDLRERVRELAKLIESANSDH